MRFLPALQKSFTSPQFYWQVLNLPLRESVFFWIKSYLALLVCALLVIVGGAFASRGIVDRYYPDDLVFTYADGMVQSNQSLPITVNQLGYTLIVGDAALDLTGPNGEKYVSSYKEIFNEMPPFTLTKDEARALAPTVLPIFTAVFTIITAVFLALVRLPLVLLYALVMKSALGLFGRKVPYAIMLQMSLHAAVVAEVLNIAYFLLYRSRTFPMYDVAFFGIMILVFRSRRVQIVRID